MEELFSSDLPHLQLWSTFGIILVAVYLFASEKLSLVLTSCLVVSAFLLLFHFAPLATSSGLFDPNSLLLGFANPALIAVLALLVLGQAVVRTGSLTIISNAINKISKRSPFLAIVTTLIMVCVISAVMNNTPTVVIFIPILLAVAESLNRSASKVMIPLSYASILGGTTVLIGSSTNLLVSSAIVPMGLEPLGFFDFTIPGLVIAAVGLVYIILVLPRTLPNRAPMSDELTGGSGRQFVAQLEISEDSSILGKAINDPDLFGEHEVTLKMLQRREHAYLAPFEEGLTIESHDVIIVTATRETIKHLLSEEGQTMFRTKSTLIERDEEGRETRPAESALAEVLITPGSKLLGQNIEQVGFHHNYHCIVLGIQRKARMITSRMTEIRLAAGDVLLVMGEREDIRTVRESKDMVVMDWSTEDLPSKKYALRVNAIFTAVIACAATNTVPIHISAFVGAALVVLTGCLNMRQALRALDAPIVFLVAAGLAMSTALQATGGASMLAHGLVELMHGAHPVYVMSAMFLLIAVLTNVLSNNATALLFAPIAVSTALELNVAPEMFIFAVIFASNCCALASPIGYQTNLLVMGPGHYKFKDYMQAGIPLVILVWITYTVFSFFYFT
ncbi:MAG: SLC13 family permease [Rickettsiales bacterium]|nr:SLC13 family permease [Rickettsiales bacterium]